MKHSLSYDWMHILDGSAWRGSKCSFQKVLFNKSLTSMFVEQLLASPGSAYFYLICIIVISLEFAALSENFNRREKGEGFGGGGSSVI